MGRALALSALIAVASAGTCSNPAHSKFWPDWIVGSTTKFINSEDIHCEFQKCSPLFLDRSGCNKIGIAYHPSMAIGTKDFAFRSQSPIPRRLFLSDIYDPIVQTFNNGINNGFPMQFTNFGAADHTNAVQKMRSLTAGDVLVYVANEYQTSFGSMQDICSALVAKGVVVLPIFVGTDVSVSQLTLLSETQKTGNLLAELLKTNGEFVTSGTAGLMLPACDHSEGKNGNLAHRRKEAIVMFARLFAQCPGSCLSTCSSTNGPMDDMKVEFPTPPSGEQGCCGPIGRPGGMGPAGNPGGTGCEGPQGSDGEDGPNGPAGEPGRCGKSGSMGRPGVKGPLGDSGVDGADGPDGPCGEPGKPGSPGQPGRTGNKGSMGNNGAPGQCGAPGQSGLRGSPGRAGDRGSSGVDGIGMISNGIISDGHDDAREALFTRAMLEIMQDQDIWNKVYNIEKQYNAFTNNVPPIKSCSCDSY